MVSSDWGQWLPEAVAKASPDGVAIWYLGCNGFVLKDYAGTTLFIDPYLGTGDPPRTVRMLPVPFEPSDVCTADAILATHEHVDHVHGPSQAPILSGTGASFHAPRASLAVTEAEAWTDNWDVSDEQLSPVEVGDTVEIGGFTVHVEPANDPDAEEPVSYAIEHEVGTFFHGGDARPGAFETIGERYDIDLGVLAFGSVGMVPETIGEKPTRTRWYSDENEIVEAANELRLDALLPSHWDIWKGMTADPTALYDHVRSFPYPKRLDIVEIGDRIDL
ncbi:MBL fold metallo-hydrolase [Halorhabdus rudnickae]|uniref:MBL fold metallo-hydrolase n=1 Tax=Halorhabdus rudnickae TaxID=1775544 RepID=UPI0010834513|nr:MBL fold metallo-hydrolase [Halorhabdus rudnickae]